MDAGLNHLVQPYGVMSAIMEDLNNILIEHEVAQDLASQPEGLEVS